MFLAIVRLSALCSSFLRMQPTDNDFSTSVTDFETARLAFSDGIQLRFTRPEC